MLPNQARAPTARVLAKSELKTPRAKTAPTDTKCGPKKRDATAPATMSLRDKIVAYVRDEERKAREDYWASWSA